uniref:Uracil-DNA glycosylase-like domain-containing protein n=1 Tax=Odontella aurita TaxID=265563 RepID=A0A7S4K3B2_9STRA|mmetsp:Transcript_60634/g.179784  ORF Transcript_60634/g.179784 Transcript_60634/m.179784 type:complete len:325 (+) Transcript_60634:204-1178(+)
MLGSGILALVASMAETPTYSPYFGPPTTASKRSALPPLVTPKRLKRSSSSSSPGTASWSTATDGDASESMDNTSTKNSPSGPPRTSSFQPIWAGSLPSFGLKFEEDSCANMKVHTLILGTHPSIASLDAAQYFGHNMNAFWWIAGDCLGFRRASGISSKGKPYKFTCNLRYGDKDIIPYDRQVCVLASHGFALWDIVESCERRGSLDANIKNERPNAIREFCASHPTVRRIVLANGGTGCEMFRRHFDTWWRSGELMPEENQQSVQAFRKYAKVTENFKEGQIRCVSAISVSPAAAKYSYSEKRAFWEEYVYQPGLRDHKILSS